MCVGGRGGMDGGESMGLHFSELGLIFQLLLEANIAFSASVDLL